MIFSSKVVSFIHFIIASIQKIPRITRTIQLSCSRILQESHDTDE